MTTDRWDDGMTVADFRIGLEFVCADRHWRCTDVGSRVAVAIRIDQISRNDGSHLTRAEAEADGWFNGPPYAVAETVFDEEDMKACVPLPTQSGKGTEV